MGEKEVCSLKQLNVVHKCLILLYWLNLLIKMDYNYFCSSRQQPHMHAYSALFAQRKLIFLNKKNSFLFPPVKSINELLLFDMKIERITKKEKRSILFLFHSIFFQIGNGTTGRHTITFHREKQFFTFFSSIECGGYCKTINNL